MDKTIFDKYGIDYANGVARCMNDEDQYARILVMFLEDDCFEQLEAAFEEKDYDKMFRCSHELKGTSGNVALNNLYKVTSSLVENLRTKDYNEAEINSLFNSVRDEYRKTIEGVRLALA